MTEEIKKGEESSDAANQKEEENVVPVSAIKGIRNELNELKNVNKNLTDQVELYKANASQSPQPKKEENEFEELDGEDILTFDQVKTMVRGIESKYSTELQKLSMGQVDSDYEGVIKEHLPLLLKENPDLTDAIRQSKNPLKLAYSLACMNPNFKKGETETKSNPVETDIDKIIANAKKPGAVSGVSGGASSGLGAAAKYEQMTDAEIMARVEEAKRKG